MNELKCPHCGQVFSVDDAKLASITSQIRDHEFEKEVKNRVRELEEKQAFLIEREVAKESLKLQKEADKQIHKLQEDLGVLKQENAKLQSMQEAFELKHNMLLRQEADKVKEQYEKKIKKLEEAQQSLKTKIEKKDLENQLALAESVKVYEDKIKDTQAQLEYYKDMKTKMSTKMVGESLEQHCQIEFNKIRMTAFKNAYFEKDNDAKTGSKGDFIFRDYDEEGTEIVSIMFEMKNEMDTTATKHKNADFFKELDKDRAEKKCEYAVLVSMLEADNELYNQGIVDVSYEYEKMYVIRPQFFIPIITLLRNAALNSMEYKKELIKVRNQDLDVSAFEDKLTKFKEGFAKNYTLASRKFSDAIEEIDKSIEHLQKIKENLLSSDRNLRYANDKASGLTIKKLTWNNPTMRKKFEEAKLLEQDADEEL